MSIDWQSRATFKQLAMGFDMYNNDNKCYSAIPAGKADGGGGSAANPYYIKLGTMVDYRYQTSTGAACVSASFLRATLNRQPDNAVSYFHDVTAVQTDTGKNSG